MSHLPLPTSDWAGWLDDRVRRCLQVASDQRAALSSAEAGSAAEVLAIWNDLSIEVANAQAITSLLSAVHPDADVIELAERLEVETHQFVTDLMLDRAVHDRLAALATDDLDAGAARVLADALRTFRRTGVDRDEATRARLRALQERATELGQAFSRGIRDGRRETRVPEDSLDGLPADFVAEHPAVDGEVVISTDYTDTHPFLEFSADAQARRAVATTFHDLAWPDNDANLGELLDVRAEIAGLLGYADWPSYDAEVKMIGDGPAIGEFVDRLRDESDSVTRTEVTALEELGAPVDFSSHRYLSQRLKRERYEVDAQEVRRYFDFAKVRQGLLDVTARLFDLTYREVDDVSWHADVTSYDVFDGSADGGALLGRIHLDLHPRERKFNHAAQFDLVPGVADRQLPEGVLVCNFPRGLMQHRDVVTLFHEFGHLLHHVLAGHHRWVRFSGVATEWDFVEAPSQMLEEWAWSAPVLQTFATDESGAPIPAELVDKMAAAEDFGKGLFVRTQAFYAALAYDLHRQRPADLTERLHEIAGEYSLVALLPGSHFHCGFGHLEGYTSAYYTYLWSKVIAKDLFSAFDPDDLFATDVARRYRDTVLAPGGSRDAADLVADFLDRPYDTRAFGDWLGA